jgi:hypothetical protein
VSTATFVGGPLGGQAVTKTGRGRWPIYRDDAGRPIRTSQGDRQFCTFAGRPMRCHYLHQTSPYDGSNVYVHATVFDYWRRPDAQCQPSEKLAAPKAAP